MKLNIIKNVIFSMLLVIFLSSCATILKLGVERLPALDTVGINRIAIMPFQPTASGSSEIASYITNTIANKFRELSRFAIVDYNTIQELQRNNTNIESYVNAIFKGEITRIDSKDSSRVVEYKNKNDEVIRYTVYSREVEIDFNYCFVKARDGSIIGPITKRGRTHSSARDNPNNLTPVSNMLRSIVDHELRFFNRDVSPYTITEKRAIAKEPSKIKELQEKMKDILIQVKAGNYKTALKSYIDIYEQYKSIAAAQNASILYESLGDTQAAANFMQQVFEETGNPKVRDILTRLNKILQDKATIAEKYNNTSSGLDKVSTYASEEIRNTLPKNAKVWIYNNASDNTLAQAVIDNLTSDFIKRGISLVDRENTKLIEAETKLQYSDRFSDDDLINICSAVGANTIVHIGITGTGDLRRLQVKVLDIEKRIYIMQSNTSDMWKI